MYFPVLFCLSVSVKWLAVKTASEMTYIVSNGALNSAPTNQPTYASVAVSLSTGVCQEHKHAFSGWSVAVLYYKLCPDLLNYLHSNG